MFLVFGGFALLRFSLIVVSSLSNMHFWSFWAKYWHFWPISSHARPRHDANKVPRWFFRYVELRGQGLDRAQTMCKTRFGSQGVILDGFKQLLSSKYLNGTQGGLHG